MKKNLINMYAVSLGLVVFFSAKERQIIRNYIINVVSMKWWKDSTALTISLTRSNKFESAFTAEGLVTKKRGKARSFSRATHSCERFCRHKAVNTFRDHQPERKFALLGTGDV